MTLATPRKVLLIDIDDVGRRFLDSAQLAGKAPNFARLRASGVDFTQFWAAHLCSPFRARVLTGLDSYRRGNMMGQLITETTPRDAAAGTLHGDWITHGMPGTKTKRGKCHLLPFDGFPQSYVGPGKYDLYSGSFANLNTNGSINYDRWVKQSAVVSGININTSEAMQIVTGTLAAPTNTGAHAVNSVYTDAAADVSAGYEFIHASFNACHGPTTRVPPRNQPPTGAGQTPTYEVLINGVGQGTYHATDPWASIGAVSSGTITISAGVAAGELVTIPGYTLVSAYNTLTFEFGTTATTPGNVMVAIGADQNSAAANLAAAINAQKDYPIWASVSGAIVTITQSIPGTLGNKTVTKTGAHIALSLNCMTGGSNAGSNTVTQRENYLMMLDWRIGTLIDAAIAADYVVIVASDNGSPGAGGKATFYTAGLNTLLFVVGNGVYAGVTTNRLVNAPDIWATVRYLRGLSHLGSPDSMCFADEFLQAVDQEFPRRKYLTCDRFNGFPGASYIGIGGAWGRTICDGVWQLTDWPDADPDDPSATEPTKGLYHLPVFGGDTTNLLNALGTATFTGVPVDGETVTLWDGVHEVTFEFDTNSSVTAGNVAVDISAAVTAADAATAFFTALDAVNTSTTTLGYKFRLYGEDDGAGTVAMEASFAGLAGAAVVKKNGQVNGRVTNATFTDLVCSRYTPAARVAHARLLNALQQRS